MTPEKREQLETLYDEARELKPEARRGFVESRCAGDSELRNELESLLQHADATNDFLESSALDLLASVVTEDPRTMEGRTVGNYKIISLIGRGGMGEVWRARDTKLKRDVAIKMLPEEFARDRERMARLQREAQLLASLNHPGIASIYGFEEHEGIHCLVLEFVEGETLANKLKRTWLPIEDSLALVIQVAEALEAAHERGVVHRDLKPANVVVTPDGHAKLLDFGLAKAFERPGGGIQVGSSSTSGDTISDVSIDGMILGTAAYMSPEQARGDSVDKRTDIWALGCILFELLTGRRAFDGEMLPEVMASILAREPDITLLHRYHPALRRLVGQCLEKDPKQRFRDAGDVRIELTHLLSHPDGALDLSRERPVRLPTGVLQTGGVVLAVALLAGTIGWYLRPVPDTPSGSFTVSAFPSQPVRPSGLTTDLAVSPDGRTVAYTVDVNGHRGIYLRDTDQLEGRLLSEEASDTPFFSPDSTWIGFSDLADGALKKVSRDGGLPETIVDLPGAARGASWGPDGTIVFATVDASTGLVRVPDRGGPIEVLTVPESGSDHLWPEFLPEGNAVLFTIRTGLGSENSQIAILDLDSGDHHVLTDGSQARFTPTGHIVYGVDDRLHAGRFDPERLTLESDPIPVFEGVVPSEFGAAMFDVSDDGTLVYLAGLPLGNNRILALVSRDGTIEPLDVMARPYLSPRLSPDQTRVAVQVDGNNGRSSIWVHDLSGTAQGRELTQEGNNIRPEWTRDGRRITFASDRDGTWGIYWQPADGSAPAERLTAAREGSQHWPESWSPDGRTLSYVVVEGEARGIRLLSIEDGEVRTEEYYDAPGFHQNGSLFSPNGDWLAYYSNESTSDNQIYVEAVPRSGVKHRITFDGGVFPLWSPNGRELFYRRPGTGAIEGTRLIRVEIEDPATFALSPEEVLPVGGFSIFGTYRDYDITADGERFLMVYTEDYADSGGPPRRQVNIMFNWFQDLVDRVP